MRVDKAIVACAAAMVVANLGIVEEACCTNNPFADTKANAAEAKKSKETLKSECGSYDGEWMDDQKHGKGKMIVNARDGFVYEGKWMDDKRHGNGKMFANEEDGFVYDGEWRGSQKHKKGKITESGDAYEGKWNDSRRHGNGKLTYCNGRTVCGEFVNGKENNLIEIETDPVTAAKLRADPIAEAEVINGKGKKKLPNGNLYEGDFLNSKPHGEGIVTTPHGTTHNVVCDNGKMHWQESKKKGLGAWYQEFHTALRPSE